MNSTIVSKIRLIDIIVSPDRAREDFSGILDLRTSIEKIGLIAPLTVQEKEGKYYLLAGETRYRALLLLSGNFPGSEKDPSGNVLVPCHVYPSELSPYQAKEIELEENLFRTDLHWSEKCKLMKQLHDLKTSTSDPGVLHRLEDTADIVNETKSYVGQQIKFAKKLEERPDLAEKVKSLPFNAAIREYEKHIENEKRKSQASKILSDLPFQLYHSDISTQLPLIPSESINLLLTDPPYGLSDIETAREKGEAPQIGETENLSPEKSQILLSLLFSHLPRILLPGSYFFIFCSPSLYGWMEKEISQIPDLSLAHQPLVWDKCTTGKFRGYEYPSCYELILYGNKLPNRIRLSEHPKNILSFPIPNSSVRYHPFEKPLDLLSLFIRSTTFSGDTVLDPFCGSGSTLLASKTLNRHSIGFEIDEKNYLTALRRLENVAV